ncbi:MAG TPA: hypothetical protein PKZ63_06635, partial [Candidatus Saccharicenans sp.]|nr:hypothetical protein [Candidatus Saccharicenans sp.]
IQKNGAEVYRATKAFEAEGINYPAGTYVILLSQPYRAFVKDLLESKAYPLPPGQDPTQHLPYDEASWTLPLQMGVRVTEVTSKFEANLNLLPPIKMPDSRIESGGNYYLVSSNFNNSVTLANRLLKNKISAGYIDRPITVGGQTYPAGSLVIDRGRIEAARMATLAKGLGLEIKGVNSVEPARIQPLTPYRLAIYQPWTASMDEGWMRWVLEQFEFDFKVVHNSDIRAGQLQSNFTHLILPSLSSQIILEGRKKGEVPPEYAGGLGPEGVSALNSFIRSGGTLIAAENAADFAIENLGLPVKNIIEPRRMRRPESQVAGQTSERVRVYSPGSILQVAVDPSRPEAFGIGEEAAIFCYFSPAFEIARAEDSKSASTQKVWNLAWFPSYDPLLSGILLNGEKLKYKSAAVACQVEKGRVILLGFDAIHRAQAHGSFKFLFNPIIYH